MGEMIFAARMKEYNKKKNYLRRNTIILGRHYTAGDATKGQKFIPSPFVIITKEEAKELLKRHEDRTWEHHQPGNPHIPIFDVFKVGTVEELMELAQSEADHRSSQGGSGARALIAGQVAKILADKPTAALRNPRQVDDEEPPEPKAKIDSVETKEEKTDPDPFGDEPTPIEGTESDTETEPEEKVAEPEVKKPAPKSKSKAKPKSKGKAKNTGRAAKKK